MIKPLKEIVEFKGNVASSRFPTPKELMDKLNEVIERVNSKR